MTCPHVVLLLATSVAVSLGGCAQTTYTGMNEKEPATPMLERRVAFQMKQAFLHRPPRCAAVVSKSAKVPPAIRRAVEESVERHLATKFQRAIGGTPARRIAARIAVDLSHAEDRRVFARQTKCGSIVEVQLDAVEDDYMVLWTNRGGWYISSPDPGRQMESSSGRHAIRRDVAMAGYRFHPCLFLSQLPVQLGLGMIRKSFIQLLTTRCAA